MSQHLFSRAGRRSLCGLHILVLALLCAATAEAELVEQDLVEGSGDSLVTLDRTTGLVWLDIPPTLGLSVDEALAAFPGFRLARRAEVDALYESVRLGLEPSPGCALCNRAVENYAGARRLLDLMGENPDHPRQWSYHDNYRELAPGPQDGTGAPPAVGRSALVIFDCCFPSHAPDAEPFLTDVFVVDRERIPRGQAGDPHIGSYLVRDPRVPALAQDAEPVQHVAPKRKGAAAAAARSRQGSGMRITGGTLRGDRSSKLRRPRDKRRKSKVKGAKRPRRERSR